MDNLQVSVVIPAKNEEAAIGGVLERLKEIDFIFEVIVVDDGSTDSTASIAKDFGAVVVSHPYSKGNGAAVKSGVRKAVSDTIVLMDADGQHRPEDIHLLASKYLEGFDLVVGQRSNDAQENVGRLAGNKLYNAFSSWMVGHKIHDLTSGFRMVDKKKFCEFLSLLPNGFSYPTTSTMAFFRSGYSVSYVPISGNKRGGDSHVNFVKDGIRFLLIIFKVGTLFSPMKVFFPVAFGFFSAGLLNYIYTYFTDGRFTNMSTLFFIASILTFMMGLMSEQLTSLFYKDK